MAINFLNNSVFAGDVTIPEYIYHAGNTSQDKFGFAGNDTFVISTNGTDKFTADANSAILLEAGITKLQTTSGGVDITGALAVGNINMTGTLDISAAYPRINLNDTNHEDDWSIINDDGSFKIYNVDDSVDSFKINSSNNATFAGNVIVDGRLKVANRWDNSTLANNAIYAQNATDGFAFGVGTAISTWFAWDNTAGQSSMISAYNDGSRVTIHQNLYLGNVDTSSNATSALVLNSSGTNEVEKRTLGTGAFGPTPVGAYLPLLGGTMSGNIAMGDNDITGIDELIFTSGTKLGDDGADNYLRLTYGDSGPGGILVYDGDGQRQGYLYGDGGATASFGLLDGQGSWAVRCLENQYVELRYDDSTKLRTSTTGVDVTGKLKVTGNGTGGAPTLDVINNSSTTFNHSAEFMTPNMTDEQNNILVIGRASSSKNAGYIGWKYKGGAGSNENILTFGHWSSDNLMNLDGLGNLGLGTETPSAKLHVVGTGLFTGKITANGGINGLTLANGGITGSNYDITGVNQLVISDPGEGIVFTGTATMYLNAVDDATDSILKLTNATQLNLNSTARITNLVNPTGAQDAATKNYVDTEVGNIPSGLAFEGNWNASTDTPTLAGTTQDNGKFWIVSVAGSTNLSGITDWAVGDWAIYVDNGAGTDAWQKVDNSSSLAGQGSAGKVTFWSSTSNVSFNTNFSYDGTNLTVPRLRVGDGTDGYFYSDAAGRTAFASGDFYIQGSVNNYYNYATNQYHGNSSGDNHYFRGNPLSGNNWNITAAGAATFGGNVTATNILTVAGAATGSPFLQFTQGGTQKAYIQYVDSGDSFELQTDNQFVVRTGGSTPALTINSSQSATFAGSITVGTNANIDNNLTVSGGNITLGGTGRIQGVSTVSSNTDAANKLYVDNAIAGVPQGDITAVVAGDYLTGGGTSGSVTLNGDNTKLAHIVNSSNGSVNPGWITVAVATNARRAGEIYVTDGESSDHSYIRIEWLRSYADSNFTVINCGGHSNRITGVRVLEQTSDTTYGPKYLQVQVTTNSNYYVIVTAPGTIPNYTDLTAVTPVLENTKTGYQLTGAQLEDLENSSVGTDEGITVGGDLFVNGGDIVLGGTGRIQGVDTVSVGTDAANKNYVDTAISGVPQGTITGGGQNLRLALWNGSTSIGSDGDFTYNGDTIFTTKLSVQNQINTNSANLEINYANGDGTTTNFKNLDIRNGKNDIITSFEGSTKNVTNRGNNFLIGGNFANNSYNSTSGARLLFGGGNSDSLSNYYIGTNINDYGGSYTKLDLAWHTGIRIGAQSQYGGVRIYNNEDFSTVLFSVGTGNTDVAVTNSLKVGAAIRTNSYQDFSGNILFLAGNTTTGASRSLNLRTSGSTSDPSTSDDSNSTGITWGQRSDSNPYYMIYPNLENWSSSGNYSKLTLAWHTGIKIGADDAYGGTRFYNNSPDVSGAAVILNVGVGNSNIGVVNNLTVGGQATGPAPTTTTSYANKAYVDGLADDDITALAFSGTTTQTLTATQRDTSTLTASFNITKIKAGGNGPGTENLNTVANSVSVGQLEYRGFNSSSSNIPPVSDNANGVITVGQHSGNYNAQLAFSSDGNMYWRDNPGSSFGSWGKILDANNTPNGPFLPLAGGTMTGKAVFPSAIASRPQLPGGFIAIDTGDADVDIWGISRDYYPSNPTTANAWGLKWGSSPNQFQWVGAGVNRITFDLDQGNIVTLGNITAPTATITTVTGALAGNASTSTTFSTGRTNYKGVTDGAVAGQLMWKEYGNNHTIFDASDGTSPSGSTISNADSTNAWTGTYPTLMGWNGSDTYGVRVDSARLADNATTAAAYLPLAGGTMTNTNLVTNMNADLLDGLSSGSFLRSDAADAASQRISFNANATNNWDTIATAAGSQGGLEVYNSGSGNDAFIAFHAGSDYAFYFGIDADNNQLSVGGWSMGANKYKVWNESNDGAGSGLNADLLDGYHLSTTRNAANTVPVRDGNGYLQLGWINTTSGATTATINKIYVSDDNYIRYITPATFRSQVIDGNYLPLAGGTITGALTIKGRINFPSSGLGTVTRGGESYGIYQESGSWTSPFPDLCIGFHTGISMGAHANYNGMRFFNDSTLATQVMSINNGSDGLGANNVYINNGLQVNGGNITLGGISGRIQGVVTVLSASDATSKSYVDTAVSGVPQGTVTGTGVNQRLAFWNGTSSIASDDELTWDGVNLNIGTFAGTGDCELRLFGSTPNNSFSTLKTTNGNLHIDSDNGHAIYLNYYLGGSTSVVIGNGSGGVSGTQFNANGTVSTGGDLTVSGGDIILSGTGRIQGVDTVSASTDAANKAYVDAAVAGVPVGDITAVTAGTGMTGGGTSGSVTLNVIGGTGITANANDVAIDYVGSDSIVMAAPSGSSPDADDYIIYGADSSGGGDSKNVQFVDIPLSIFDNDAGFITNSGVVLTSGTQSISGIKSFTSTIVTSSSQTRNKISVWSNSNEYTIGMMSNYTYGGLGNEYAMSFQMNNNSNRGFWWGDNGQTNAQGAMALTTNGLLTVASAIRLGYGETDTTSPGGTYKLDVSGNTLMNGVGVVRSSTGVGDFYLGNYATAKHFRFHTNNNQTYFDMNCGQINWREGSSTRYYFYPSTANMTINGTLTQNSDSRVKENVVEIDNCISKVQAMRGVYYNRTDFNTEVTKVGVIAQEVEAVLPELILEASDTGLKSVAYAELTAVLINAIKEQQEIIEDLKTRIIKLEK